MDETEPIELQLQKARSLFQQWQGFSARVLFYDGDPGMFAQFSILFSSPQGRNFRLRCGVCDLVETTFQWTVDKLEIDISDEFKNFYIHDDANHLSICTSQISIMEFLNDRRMLEFRAGMFQDDIHDPTSCVDINNLNFANKIINLKDRSLDLGAFDPIANELPLFIRRSAKADSSEIFRCMVFQQPIYWKFKYLRSRMMTSNLEFQILDNFTIQAEGKNGLNLSAKFKNISIVNYNDFYLREIESVFVWRDEFLSTPALFELQPRCLMNLNVD
jgi:hypothetical protein